MKELLEYAQLSVWSPKEGDQLRLYEMALAGVSREEARTAFDISDNHFNVLYKKLKDRMSLGILGNPLSSFSRVKRLQFGIRRQYETSMMLIQTDRKTAGIPLARAAMRKAEKYGLTQVALDLARELRSYYRTQSPDKKLAEYHSQKVKYLFTELGYELAAEEVFFEYGYNLKKGLPTPDISSQLDELDKIPAKSYRFHYMRFLGRVIYYQVARMEKEMLTTCNEALQFFERYESLPYVVKFSFFFRAIAVQISRNEFEQAELTINKSLEGPAYGRHNWQVIMLHRALLGFHCGKLAIAVDAYSKAVKVPKKFRTEEIDQRWKIIRAYLELFDFDIDGKWRLRKFLNSVGILEGDKKGQKVSIIVVELLHHLKAQQFEKYQRCSQKLNDYIQANLKERGRYMNFLRLLQCIERSGFDAREARRKGSKYMAALRGKFPRIGADVESVEVLPFEKLWEMALGWLK